MSKQEVPQSPLAGSGDGGATREGRYYVQALTEHIFLVRECQSTTGKPGPDDSIVRSFDIRFDAYHYANSMNE